MFDCLCDCMPSTSAGVGTRCARPGRSSRGPAFTDTDVTHYDWLYVGKCTDAMCVAKFEGGVCRIPTQI